MRGAFGRTRNGRFRGKLSSTHTSLTIGRDPEAEPLDTNHLTEKNPEYPRSITEWTLYLGFRQADATTATMIW